MTEKFQFFTVQSGHFIKKMIQIKSTHDMGIELWFIRGDDPPAAEMAFSSKSFQLFNKKLRHFKLNKECSTA